jgi:5-methylcytosine-specific restriction protein A
MPDGKVFLETHHVIPLSEGGGDTEGNVVALCPNHHREAHHGANRDRMRIELSAIAAFAS